ncbi:MAG: hypothetical protein AB7D24_12580 [Sphaerochaeta sp.]
MTKPKSRVEWIFAVLMGLGIVVAVCVHWIAAFAYCLAVFSISVLFIDY